MKSFYKKGMTVEQIQEASDKSWQRLWDVQIYLNDAGKAAMIAHGIIGDACIFSRDYKELIKEIHRQIKEKRLDEMVQTKLNNFIKKYLEVEDGNRTTENVDGV